MSLSAEAIFKEPEGKQRKAALARIAGPQTAKDDSGIDYADIPALTYAQLAEFRQTSRVLVAARLDRYVYNWLQTFGRGYSTRINSILRTVMNQPR